MSHRPIQIPKLKSKFRLFPSLFIPKPNTKLKSKLKQILKLPFNRRVGVEKNGSDDKVPAITIEDVAGDEEGEPAPQEPKAAESVRDQLKRLFDKSILRPLESLAGKEAVERGTKSSLQPYINYKSQPNIRNKSIWIDYDKSHQTLTPRPNPARLQSYKKYFSTNIRPYDHLPRHSKSIRLDTTKDDFEDEDITTPSSHHEITSTSDFRKPERLSFLSKQSENVYNRPSERFIEQYKEESHTKTYEQLERRKQSSIQRPELGDEEPTQVPEKLPERLPERLPPNSFTKNSRTTAVKAAAPPSSQERYRSFMSRYQSHINKNNNT